MTLVLKLKGLKIPFIVRIFSRIHYDSHVQRMKKVSRIKCARVVKDARVENVTSVPGFKMCQGCQGLKGAKGVGGQKFSRAPGFKRC